MTLRRDERSGIWHYEFEYKGIRHRKSTGETNKEVAQQIENDRKRELRNGFNGIKPEPEVVTFKTAFEAFVKKGKIRWKKGIGKDRKGEDKMGAMERSNLNNGNHLIPFFGSMILQEIVDTDLEDYQAFRQEQVSEKTEETPSNATINSELATLRQIMTERKLWLRMMEGSTFKFLPANKDRGRELTDEEVSRLLDACMKSCSVAIYPAVMLSIYTGLRSSELRTMRWSQVDFVKCIVTVGESKTEAGKGRKINLNANAIAILKNWRNQFPDWKPVHCVFPSQLYRLAGGNPRKDQRVTLYKTIPDVPVQNLNHSWRTAKAKAGVECRWHDLRHTCASRLAAAGATDQALMDLLGWMSVGMIRRYSHVRNQAKQLVVSNAFDNWDVLNQFHVPTPATGVIQ